MFVILLCLFNIWGTSGSRVRLRIGKSPQYTTECGATGNERRLALALQSELQACSSEPCKNPFTSCSDQSRYFSLDALAQEPLKLCTLGKLAKNGNFFSSEDEAVLVKRVDILEAEVLQTWGDWALTWEDLEEESQYPGGCVAFHKSLLLSMLASFTWDGRPFVVMPNMTHYLEEVAARKWRVHAVYDTKPLPNLGEGLVKLFKDLQNQWGDGLTKMSEWDGWDNIRNQLLIDLQFLEDRVVDFSLFVHVLRSQGEDQSIPKELEFGNACVVDPSKTIMVCFNILDYLTPWTWKRKIESKYKASKFDEYGSKFLLAFDCIGDSSQSQCANYKALASITEAMSVSKAMAKAVFIGADAFPTAYTCTKEEPYVQYKKVISEMKWDPEDKLKETKEFGEVVDISDLGTTIIRSGMVGRFVDWKSSESSAGTAQWLQSIATPEAGTQYIGNTCDSTNISAFACMSATVEDAYLSRPLSIEHKEKADHWTKENLDECVAFVNKFATESYTSWGNRSNDMHNVLWAPSQKSVLVVRGLPQVPVVRFSPYWHRDAVERAREENCFLRMRYLKCTPTESAGVYFNYKQHFGTLEVMVLSTQEQYSADAEAFAILTERGYRVVSSLELALQQM